MHRPPTRSHRSWPSARRPSSGCFTPPGRSSVLDGGSLDLGVVRTKEDVQKNMYCEFSETFEAVAYMGPASPNGWVFHGKTAVDLLGSHSGPTDLSP